MDRARDHPPARPVEVEEGNLKIFPVVGVTILVLAIPAALCLGARLQREQDAREIADLIRRGAAYRNELEVMDDLWLDCVLSERIRFPGDTALRLSLAQ